MQTNSKCHLQFLEIYLFCTFCHIACILVLTKPVSALMKRNREWRLLTALFEGQILFLALLNNWLSQLVSAMLSKDLVSLQSNKNVTRQLKVISVVNLSNAHTYSCIYIFLSTNFHSSADSSNNLTSQLLSLLTYQFTSIICSVFKLSLPH